MRLIDEIHLEEPTFGVLRLQDELENVIISLYAKGMSVSDIEEQIREVYDFDVSPATISRITDAVTADIVVWQNRALEPVYLIV